MCFFAVLLSEALGKLLQRASLCLCAVSLRSNVVLSYCASNLLLVRA